MTVAEKMATEGSTNFSHKPISWFAQLTALVTTQLGKLNANAKNITFAFSQFAGQVSHPSREL